MAFIFGKRRNKRSEIRFKSKGKKRQNEIDNSRVSLGLGSLLRVTRSCLKCEKEF